MHGDDAPPPEEPPRLLSGTPYFDEILGGGLIRGGVYLIVGAPGTGKTTLANQCAFALAARGESTIYLTLLTETHDRMVLHLGTMRFFRRDAVGTRVHYISGAGAFREGGLRALAELLGQMIRQHKASLLVIDGFAALHDAVRDRVELREFLQSIAVRTGLSGSTTLLLANDGEKGARLEQGMVDGVVALSADLHGLKATRGIEVVKLRGSENIPGKHTLRIGRDGVWIYPRFEAAFTTTSTRVPDPSVRLSTGVPDLDAMCCGGLVSLSNTLVLGSPGSGKTLVGMNFLAAGARAGERALYMGFAETGEELTRKCQSLALDLTPWLESGALRLEVRAPVETLPDALAQQLVELVDRHGFQRLFLDGLEPFAKEALDPERTTRFVTAMLNAMRERGVTVLVTQQTNELFGPELHAPIRGVEAICDNVLFLRFFELYGELHRMISVLKMRDSRNDPRLRELELTAEGLRIGSSYAEVEAMMTGQPRDRHDGRRPPTRRKPVKAAVAKRRTRAGRR